MYGTIILEVQPKLAIIAIAVDLISISNSQLYNNNKKQYAYTEPTLARIAKILCTTSSFLTDYNINKIPNNEVPIIDIIIPNFLLMNLVQQLALI